MDKLLLKVHEAADLLGISRAKMYELLAEGSIPAIRVGSSLRVPVQQLQQWVNDRGAVAEKPA